MTDDRGAGPSGLSVPLVTVLDAAGRPIESDQRALVRHVMQRGRGADILFYMGTTGEWDRVSNAVRQAVIRVCADEVARENRRLLAQGRAPVASWAGVTAPSRAETLANLSCAIEAGADAAVLAPLAISDVRDPVGFVREEVAERLAGDELPIYLYDNAEIATSADRPYLDPAQARALARLDFVRGIKVSAPIDVVDAHLRRAAAHDPAATAPRSDVYVGYASLVFELFERSADEPRPTGLVSGPANCLPCEWACAWDACVHGDVERVEAARCVVDAFRALTFAAAGRRTIAALKRALWLDGVISSAALAKHTPDFADTELEDFELGYAQVKSAARERLDDRWVTRLASDPAAS